MPKKDPRRDPKINQNGLPERAMFQTLPGGAREAQNLIKQMKNTLRNLRQEGRKAQCNFEACSRMDRFIALSIAFTKVSCLLSITRIQLACLLT